MERQVKSGIWTTTVANVNVPKNGGGGGGGGGVWKQTRTHAFPTLRPVANNYYNIY